MTNPVPVERIRGRALQALRDRILTRDKGLCQACKRKGRITPLNLKTAELDHIVALVNGGTNDYSNLESLCHDCHAEKTDADLGRKPRVTIGLDGWPTEQERSSGPVWRRKGYR